MRIGPSRAGSAALACSPGMTPRWLLILVVIVAFSTSAPAHARAPVIVVVFDEFPVDSLLRPDGRIDAARYPAFGRLSRVATWFPNTFSVQDQTSHALPAILDGRYPRRGGRPVYSDHPDSLFTFLASRGYRVTATEPITSICPPSVCPESILGGIGPQPFFLTKRAARFRAMLRAIRRTRQPLLIFQHQVLPHQPWEFLPSGRRYRGDPDPWEGGLSSPRGFHDGFLTHQNQQRFLLQVGFVDRELGLLLDRLERTALFDRALLVLTADHGIGFDLGVTDRRAISEANIAEVAPVPFFVKAPHQRRSRVRRAYVHTVDVLPTIADVLGLKLPWNVDGRSAFARRGPHRVRLPTFEISHWVDVAPARLERARAANRQHQARLFGVGDRSLFRFGRWRGPLGRRVHGVPRSAEGPNRERLKDRSHLPSGIRSRAGLVHWARAWRKARYYPSARAGRERVDRRCRPNLLPSRLSFGAVLHVDPGNRTSPRLQPRLPLRGPPPRPPAPKGSRSVHHERGAPVGVAREGSPTEPSRRAEGHVLPTGGFRGRRSCFASGTPPCLERRARDVGCAGDGPRRRP